MSTLARIRLQEALTALNAAIAGLETVAAAFPDRGGYVGRGSPDLLARWALADAARAREAAQKLTIVLELDP